MKKVICTLLTVGTVVSVNSSSIFAMDTINRNFNINQNVTNIVNENSDLTELLDKGKDSYEILEMNGNSVVSQFIVDNQKYIVDEIISNSYDEVVSKYYKEVNGYKEYLGQTKTIINTISEDLSNIQILDDNNIVDSQYVRSEAMSYNDNHEELETDIVPFATIEYKWHYQFTSKGSTKIIKYTVGTIIAVLAGEAGSATAAGLAYIANEIIQDNIPDIWWTQDTYA